MKDSQILSTFGPTAPQTAPKPPTRPAPLVFDACHAGVVLRAVMFVETVMGVAALYAVNSFMSWVGLLGVLTCAALPGTLAWLVVACLLKHTLARLPVLAQYAVGSLLGATTGLYGCGLLALTGFTEHSPWLASACTGALLAGLLVASLVWRARARTPAATTARLAELQSRIRPHFLFNTLNSAIALVRAEPARAETLLEDLSDLFRAALVEHGETATLGMDGVCQNSLDAVSDRDFAIEFTAAASLAMVHISRLSEELILWMSQNFGFIQIADRFTTGSSIMPQKKNPDVPELARGKTGRVVGHLMGLITLMKGQPLAYNKDNQEDKEPLFDTVDTLKDTLRIFAEMVEGITVRPQAMEDAAKRGYATATDLADYLVKKGLPFRDAHETVAHAVKAAISHNVDLSELPLAVLQQFNPNIDKDVYEVLSLRGSLNARNTLGGTAPDQVRAQIERHRTRLA